MNEDINEIEKKSTSKNTVTKIADLDINKMKLLLPYIEEHLKKGKFILDISPLELIIRMHQSFVDDVDEILELSNDELKEIITTFGLIISDIIKDEDINFLNRVEKNYADHLDKCKEVYSYLKNNFNLLSDYKEKYLLKLYSKCFSFRSIEWDVQTKYYHSDIEKEIPFPLAMIRLIFYAPLFVEGKKENIDDVTFEISLSDIITLREELEKIEDKLKDVIKKVEA